MSNGHEGRERRDGPELPIICFSKDWNDDATCNHHVLRELAKTRDVVWVNSISTRAPKLSSGRDLRRIAEKIKAFTEGPVQVEKSLWVFTPLVLPFPRSRVALIVNRQILRASLYSVRRRLGIHEFELWTFLPSTAHLAGRLGESFLVYYCTDEWPLFSSVDPSSTRRSERALLARADVVFATCEALVESKRRYNPATYLMSHGVDHAMFARALAPELPIPEDLARIPRPVVGFYGTIEDWVDLGLLAHLAARHPEWSIVLIGQVLVDVSSLRRYPNVFFLDRKPHNELPGYCKGFGVGIVPYILGERMKYVNPIKLREYISAGLPVVSTPLPEVRPYRQYCVVAETAPEFEGAIAEALAGDSPQHRRERSDSMRAETWTAKVAELQSTIDRIRSRSHSGMAFCRG